MHHVVCNSLGKGCVLSVKVITAQGGKLSNCVCLNDFCDFGFDFMLVLSSDV